MDERERYCWDLTGYLIVRQVLKADELAAANVAVDANMDCLVKTPDNGGAGASTILRGSGRTSLKNALELESPHCDPFRKMLVHPQVVQRLNVMCGKGFRHDHGSWVFHSEKGTEGLTLHGQGEPHRPVVAYHHQNGQPYCNGVTVTWQLADCKAGDGGFVCVPGSHKARYPMPAGVRTCEDDLGVVLQPELQAGDVLFFMDGAQTHGTLTWKSSTPRRSVLFKYASRTATRSGVATRLAPPEIYWDEEIVEGMSAAERAVMYGPCSNAGTGKVALRVDADGTVRLDE